MANAVPSMLRGFSAPVIVHYDYAIDELALLAAGDDDAFNRWDAGQTLALKAITQALAGDHKQADLTAQAWVNAAIQCLNDTNLNPAFKAEMLLVPAETLITEQVNQLDAGLMRKTRLELMFKLALAMRTEWANIYHACAISGSSSPDPASMGKRSLRQIVLTYWAMTGNADAAIIAHFKTSDNMTEKLGALNASRFAAATTRDTVFAAFAAEFGQEVLAMDKWYVAHATSVRIGQAPVLDTVKKLLADPAFDRNNPNRLRSLVAGFMFGNLAEFHNIDGSGYRFFEEQILSIDAANPQIGARFARAMDRWPQFAKANQDLMLQSLNRLSANKSLSGATREVVEKALQANKGNHAEH